MGKRTAGASEIRSSKKAVAPDMGKRAAGASEIRNSKKAVALDMGKRTAGASEIRYFRKTVVPAEIQVANTLMFYSVISCTSSSSIRDSITLLTFFFPCRATMRPAWLVMAFSR